MFKNCTICYKLASSRLNFNRFSLYLCFIASTTSENLLQARMNILSEAQCTAMYQSLNDEGYWLPNPIPSDMSDYLICAQTDPPYVGASICGVSMCGHIII